jgi:hypothetical protein
MFTLHRFWDFTYTHLVVFLLARQNYTCLSLDALSLRLYVRWFAAFIE